MKEHLGAVDGKKFLGGVADLQKAGGERVRSGRLKRLHHLTVMRRSDQSVVTKKTNERRKEVMRKRMEKKDEEMGEESGKKERKPFHLATQGGERQT